MAGDRNELLRDGLLAGVTLAVAVAPGAHPSSTADVIAQSATALGAIVSRVELVAGDEAASDIESRLAAIVSDGAACERRAAFVIDTAGAFAAESPRDGLVGSLAATWNAARAAGLALIAADTAGRIVVIAPAAGGEHAGAALAGAENLARTLSTEWARYGITTVAIAPGEATAADELATLTCWLLSPAGAYFSGCLLDLRGPAAA